MSAKTAADCAVSAMLALTSFGAMAAEHGVPEVETWPGWHSGWHPHMHGYSWLFPLLVMFLFVVFFMALRRDRRHWHSQWRKWMRDLSETRGSQSGPSVERESAMDILDKRFARSEIEKPEYEEKKAAIASSSTKP